MFLKKLRITKSDGTLIREIIFNNTLNIISEKSEVTDSTNSIDKTTLLRVIDFCLDGKLQQFCKDNKPVFEFLNTCQLTFELELNQDTKTLIIKRKIIINKSRLRVINYINDEKKSKNEFTQILAKELFNLQGKKPSFRQLISKFIRKDTTHTENLMRYLHQSTKEADYEKIHLFMFGFTRTDLLQKKHDKEKELKTITQQLQALTEEFSENALEQIINLKKAELASLLKAREHFQINEKYELEEKQLNEIQLKLNNIETKINDLNLSHSLQLERIEKLKKDEFNVDINALNLLYQEAGFYIKEMQKTFQDTVAFHNTMLKQDLKNMKNRLAETKKELHELIEQRTELAEHYSKILQKLEQTGSLAEYTKLNQQIEEIIKEISKKESLLNTIKNLVNYKSI